MLEVLQIIILACQISPGVGGSVSEVHGYQVKCQKELINCVGQERMKTKIFACLRERKETRD
jgi:hypothetical protein